TADQGAFFPLLPGVLLLAVGGAIQWWLMRRYPSASSTRYAVGSWQVVLMWTLAVGLFLFTVSELLGDTYVPLQIAAEMAEDATFPPLAPQMAAGGGVVLAGIGIALLRWLRRFFQDEYVHARQRGLIQAGVVILWLVILALGIYLVTVLQLDVDAASQMRDFDRNEVLDVGMALTGMERNEFRGLYGSMDGEDIQAMLLAWPQIVAVLLGLFLLVMAYRIWKRASRSDTSLGLSTLVILALVIAFAGWLLIGELPQALAVGDTAYYQALLITTAYSIGTVPVQLALGLLLAYILFYEISIGKSLYRMIYFMPYIAPTVATATVFGIMFSSRNFSLANQGLNLLGLPPQDWLLESKGVFQVIAELIFGAGTHLPDFLVGPSLALVSIILYNIWVFAGYNAVIFLAGLGAIPHELFEAAKVDGAGRWASFRKITFPLLSPTTFFLSVLSISGTFRAFSHIYVLRRDAARGTSDTASVHIFVQFWQFNQWGYASAMSFVLFGIIVILTLVQNQVAKERVFYG
ncbi:MAG: sugar ABC transporter permease, partial [Anaerolineae bacterium]|nr:sugar ABC transporter permease [Anaerolineae bacterium]